MILKLALADTDDELQKVVENYLCPVLLILENDSESIRTKVLFCFQYIIIAYNILSTYGLQY